MEEAARVRGEVPFVVGEFDFDGVEGRKKVDVCRLRMHVELLNQITEGENLIERRKKWHLQTGNACRTAEPNYQGGEPD